MPTKMLFISQFILQSKSTARVIFPQLAKYCLHRLKVKGEKIIDVRQSYEIFNVTFFYNIHIEKKIKLKKIKH